MDDKGNFNRPIGSSGEATEESFVPSQTIYLRFFGHDEEVGV